MTSQEAAPKSELDLHGLTLAQAQEVIDIYARHLRLRLEARSMLRNLVDHAYLDDVTVVPFAAQKRQQDSSPS